MKYESTGFQGLTDAQSDLISYWRKAHTVGIPPARESLDPGAIRGHLSSISIVEIGRDGQARFRLAGSKLRQIFGQDMRGRSLTELAPTAYEMWSLGLSCMLEQQRPLGGLIERGSDAHAWLRLPLQTGPGGALILCHDSLIPSLRLTRHPSGQFDSHKVSVSNIAA